MDMIKDDLKVGMWIILEKGRPKFQGGADY